MSLKYKLTAWSLALVMGLSGTALAETIDGEKGAEPIAIEQTASSYANSSTSSWLLGNTKNAADSTLKSTEDSVSDSTEETFKQKNPPKAPTLMPDGVNLPAPAATKSRGLSQAEREAAAELAASGDTTTTIVDISKPKPPTTIAGAAVLINADTNEIYFEQNADNWMHPASTTKMVTLLTALRLKGTELDRLATISPYAASMEPSVLGVRPGDQISLEGILEGMMTVSGNDAAGVAAENVSGSVAAFAQEMNKTAKMAGATQSNFLNPHGLTEQGHHTTARDLAKIAAYGMRIPMFRDMVANDYYNVPYQNRPQETVRTTNLFIRNKYPGANGLKTGYTQAAGDCLIASATRDGHTMIAVFLNDDDRWTDAVKFLDYGFAMAKMNEGK